MPPAVCGRRRNDTLYEMRYESGRATARVAPTKGYKECDVVKNPPVTASPCQPPLGKGAERTGGRIAAASVRTGFAMTGGFARGAVRGRRRGEGTPPYGRVIRGAVGGEVQKKTARRRCLYAI